MFRKIIVVGIVFVLFISACGTERMDRADRSAYPNDGYLGLSNSNPNLQTSRTHYNYKKDFRRARQILGNLPHINDARIILDGGVMRVRLKLQRELNREQIGQLQQEAYRLLDYEFPRYKIIVTNNLNNVRIPNSSSENRS